MKRLQKWTAGIGASCGCLVVIGALAISWTFATRLTSNPVSARTALLERKPFYETAALLEHYQLTGGREVSLTTSDGFQLTALYFPSQNGAAIIFQHGYKDIPTVMTGRAAMMVHKGYGALIPSLRAHGSSHGELITMGHFEREDLNASYQYLLEQADVDPSKIGIYGVSMGGALALLHAAENSGIAAVMVEGAYTSFQDTLNTTIPRLTGLPAFPFGSMILTMVEWRHNLDMDDLAPIHAVGRISPRPVLILVGGADTVVNPQCGEQLYQAAGEPRELWVEPELEHGTFARDRPEALESRMETFFGRYLLSDSEK